MLMEMGLWMAAVLRRATHKAAVSLLLCPHTGYRARTLKLEMRPSAPVQKWNSGQCMDIELSGKSRYVHDC